MCDILVVFRRFILGGVTTLTTAIINDKMVPKGFKLLTEEYTNNSNILEWECQECKGTFLDKYANLKRSCRCKCCNGVQYNSVESIGTEWKEKGYTLLSTNYTNPSSDLQWRKDSCKHEFTVGLRNMQRASFCRVCEGPTKYTIEGIRRKIKSHGIFLISEEFNTNTALLDWVCTTCGYTWKKGNDKMAAHCFCPKCRGVEPLSTEEINDRINHRSFRCITEGIHKRSTNVEWKCSNVECNHTWFRSYTNTVEGGIVYVVETKNIIPLKI